MPNILFVKLNTEIGQYSLIKRAFQSFKYHNMAKCINSVIVQENEVFILDLPYNIKEINKKRIKNKVLKFIKDLHTKENVKKTVCSDDIEHIFLNQECGICDGKDVYFSMLPQIIEAACKKSRISMQNVDVAIISGENNQKLWDSINLTINKVKYLTVLSADKEIISGKMDEICETNGTSVRITDNIKSAFQNSNIIINLKDNFKFNTSIRSKAILINYGTIENTKITRDRMVVNWLKFDIPQNIRSIFQGADDLKIAEALNTTFKISGLINV